ncbi:tRNA (adenosine(37)-N6)-dimethylallyltransferase MiaA [Candidatus Uhrbacteria bacterium]|nr:tRNA (adenosine(37)-N6)-dimethylallyltransferase MiaA [Candidatus Uhrbacteria bacterium]
MLAMTEQLPKIFVMCGPTASGKTDLSIFLAKKFGGEIVNADSRQIYRGMDIATAKPKFNSFQLSAFSFQGVRHHVFDIASPDEVVTVAIWKQKAIRAIRGILRRGHVPIVVGGTGLYIKTLVENLDIPQVPPNLKLRAMLERELAEKGITSLWHRLIKLDPDAIHVVQSNNSRRVIRALEVCLATHQPFTKLRVHGPVLFNAFEIGITVPRVRLYRRIDRRVEWQMRHGLVRETRRLLKKYPRTLPAMTGIGYGEIADYLSLRGVKRSNLRRDRHAPPALAMTLDEVAQKIKFHTHNFARRQLIWFRRDPKIHWIKTKKQATRLAREFLS